MPHSPIGHGTGSQNAAGSKQESRTDGFTKVDYDSIIDVDNEQEPRI